MSEWIEHDGKGMPVNGETEVIVKFRDKQTDLDGIFAEFWHDDNPKDDNWTFNNDLSDITHYQIVTQDKESNDE